jgi:hypothetical protein
MSDIVCIPIIGGPRHGKWFEVGVKGEPPMKMMVPEVDTLLPDAPGDDPSVVNRMIRHVYRLDVDERGFAYRYEGIA